MNPEIIQINIGFIEGIVGIIAVVVSIGVAWGKLNSKVDSIVDDIDGINNKIEKIENRIEKIETKLGDHGESIVSINASMSAYGIHESPMKPSDEGKNLLKESGFYELYPKIKGRLFESLDKMQTRTLYDIEMNSRMALRNSASDPLFDNMKNFVVNNPEKQLELIFGVASWIIRDDYAKERNITK